MKKILLILLLCTGFLQAQTLTNPTYNKTTTNTLVLKTPATVTSVNFLSTVEADGSISKIAPVNLPFAQKTDVVYKRTMAEIRALSGTLSSNNFYTTDLGQEGTWYYDASDTTTADNTGAVLVTADGKRIKRVYSDKINVKWFGAKGDGSTDDLTAIQNAITYISTIPTNPLGISNRLGNKPELYFPAGTYRITNGFSPITFNYFTAIGEGENSSTIYYDSSIDVPVFDFGTFSAAPSDIYAGAGGMRFENIAINGRLVANLVDNKGTGIRASGGGGLKLNNVRISHFKLGVTCPYGGDFNSYTNSLVESCYTGVYQGPGGQQFYTANLNVYGCYEGTVLDRFGHAEFNMPIFNGNTRCGLLLESISDTQTRFITFSGGSFQSKLVINTPWLESNAGGLGDRYVTTNYFENSNGGTDAYRDIVINDPFIVAGNTGTKTTTSFFNNTSGVAAQRVSINRLVFSGVMTRFLTNPGNATTLDEYRVTTGYTAPAISNTTGYVLKNNLGLGNVAGGITGNATAGIEYTVNGGISDNDITRIEHLTNGVVRYAFKNAGTFLYRYGFDIQNSRLYLSDPSASGFSISRAVAMPTSGTYAIGSFVYNQSPSALASNRVLLGWQRLTTGSGHVLNTDWKEMYSLNSTLDYAPNILTGFVAGAGTVSGTDSVLQGIQKNSGSIALKANINNPAFTGFGSAVDLSISGGLYLAATSSYTTGGYDFTVRNSTTGLTERVPSNVYATVISPTFSGDPKAPTPVNPTSIANKAYVDSAVSASGTMQATYNNSTSPQITTTTGLGAITIKRGSASDTDNILRGQNGAGTTTFSLTGQGALTSTSAITGQTMFITAGNLYFSNDGAGYVPNIPLITRASNRLQFISSTTNTNTAGLDTDLLTVARTYQVPDASGVLALTSQTVNLVGTQTVTGDKTFTGGLTAQNITISGSNPVIGFGSARSSSLGSTASIARIGTNVAIIGSPNTSNYGILFDNALLTSTDRTYQFPNSNGVVALTSDITNAVTGAISNINTSASTLTLSVSSPLVSYYVFTGTTATWTLPVPSGNTTKKLSLINTGSGTVTVNTNAGANVLYNSGSTTNTYALLMGSNIELYSDGTRWIVL